MMNDDIYFKENGARCPQRQCRPILNDSQSTDTRIDIRDRVKCSVVQIIQTK